MINRKINIDRPDFDPKEISKARDFEKIVAGHKKIQTSFHTKISVIGTALSAVIAVGVLSWAITSFNQTNDVAENKNVIVQNEAQNQSTLNKNTDEPIAQPDNASSENIAENINEGLENNNAASKSNNTKVDSHNANEKSIYTKAQKENAVSSNVVAQLKTKKHNADNSSSNDQHKYIAKNKVITPAPAISKKNYSNNKTSSASQNDSKATASTSDNSDIDNGKRSEEVSANVDDKKTNDQKNTLAEEDQKVSSNKTEDVAIAYKEEGLNNSNTSEAENKNSNSKNTSSDENQVLPTGENKETELAVQKDVLPNNKEVITEPVLNPDPLQGTETGVIANEKNSAENKSSDDVSLLPSNDNNKNTPHRNLIGIKGGAGQSTVQLVKSSLPELNLTYLVRPGNNFNAGIFMEMPLYKFISFQPELIYSQRASYIYMESNMKGTYHGIDGEVHAKTNIDFTINYIEIPMMIKMTKNFKKVHFFVNCGPYAALNIQGKGKGGYTADVNSSVSFYQISDDHLQDNFSLTRGSRFGFKFIDLGAAASAGSQIKIGNGYLYIEARYYYGFTDIMNSGKFLPADYEKTHHRSYGASIGYSIYMDALRRKNKTDH